MYNVKTPLLDDLIVRLKKKDSYECNDLQKAIDEALKLKEDRKKYNYDDPKWELQMEKYQGQIKYIDGYLRALLCVNIIRSFNKMCGIRKEVQKIMEYMEVKNDKG